MKKWRTTWVRPNRQRPGGDYDVLSTAEHLSCWDCKHIRVAGFPARMCNRHPRMHIYGVGKVDYEVYNEGIMGRHGSVADRCGDFRVASEFRFLLLLDESEA